MGRYGLKAQKLSAQGIRPGKVCAKICALQGQKQVQHDDNQMLLPLQGADSFIYPNPRAGALGYKLLGFQPAVHRIAQSEVGWLGCQCATIVL